MENEHVPLQNSQQANTKNLKRTRQDAELDNDDTVAEDEQDQVQPPAKQAKIENHDAVQFQTHALAAAVPKEEQQIELFFGALSNKDFPLALQFVMNNSQILHAYNTDNTSSDFCGLTGFMALVKSAAYSKSNIELVQEWVLNLVVETVGKIDMDMECNTILHYVAKYPGFYELVKMFKDCTPMRTTCNDQGLIPLQVAMVEWNWPVVELLMHSSTSEELNAMCQYEDKFLLPFQGTLVHFLIYRSKFLPKQGVEWLKYALSNADLCIVTEQSCNQGSQFVGMNGLMLAIMCGDEQVAMMVFNACKATLDADMLQLVLQTESFRGMTARQLCDLVGNMEQVANAIGKVAL